MRRHLFAKTLSAAALLLWLTLPAAAQETYQPGDDVTDLLKNARFDKKSGWTVTEGSPTFDTGNRLVEQWWGNMRIEQQIEGIPNGIYRLQIQGFQWGCWDWTTGQEWWRDGRETVTAEVALNDDATSVNNLYSVGATTLRQGYNATLLGYYVPNSAATARKFFDLGLYENSVETQVTDGKLTVGISMVGNAYWCCFANARLTYVGELPQGGDDEPAGTCHLTAMETARRMGLGWNLGNTLEGGSDSNNFTNNGGVGAELAWQGTRTTQQLIDYVRDLGFRSIRIPCSWVQGHISDAENFTIDKRWMKRVREVVDYCIKDSLYVVLNDHQDGNWLQSKEGINATGEAKERNKRILHAIWTQIAEEFKNYGHHLLFAGLNEPDATEAAEIANLKEYEQIFIDAVRATGGNNANRVLVVQSASTSIELACQYYKEMLPDTADDRLMIEVHYYNPWQFWGMENDQAWGYCFYYWGKDNHVPGSLHNPDWDCEEGNMRYWLKMMYNNFTRHNIPVLIGEYGANWRDLGGMAGESQEKHDASIHLYYKLICQYSLEYGHVPMVWDNNYPHYGMTIIDRSKLQIYNSIMMDAISQSMEGTRIEATEADPVEGRTPKEKIYDLQGRQVDPATMQRGIYIRGGKKFVKH